MEFLIREYRIDAKFCISIHDSILYMVKESQSKQLAALFQVSHSWVWAWLRANYSVYEMPINNAWFSSVEIDHIFRKSSTEKVNTVSNNFQEKDGQSLTICDIIETCNSMFNT